MCKQLFILKTPKELVRQRDPESMFAPICVVALIVHSRLVWQVCFISGDKSPWGLIECAMTGVNMNLDGAPLPLLACPSVNVVLVALKRNSVDNSCYRPCMSALGLHGGRDERKMNPCDG